MSGRLPTVSGLEVAKLLHREGFEPIRQRGSHLRMEKAGPGTVLSVTIPGHKKDLKKGTLMGILHQAGLSKSDFLELLSA
ncbi:addiction module toxin, HicA family [Heliobacillus mobilis]|uniref:Addiction module toxin, HicA family n=1 Tax=Heliobacterium mobile TaxID=28064 RepID=A0A6I3SQH4_HELMO|nr:type II toxin-antitoxin system HicA family toxin [Heliobacterium mobile]MTV50945.1 addiction module toxin, HicA family [Heliobacterium mobile]